MEFVIAAVGLIVAVWMIVSARGRHRDAESGRPPKSPPDTRDPT
jgi:hypothetical protein